MDILEGMDTLAHAHHVHVSLLLSHHVPGSICHTHHYVQEDVVACGAYTWYVVLLQVLEAMRKISGKELAAEHKPPRDGDIKESLGTPDSLQAAISWEAKMALEDGLRDIL